jgi:type I restriction enzyme S subunit
LGECIKTTSGGTPSRKKIEFYENGTYQWIKSKELNGGYIIETEEKITDEALRNSSAKLLPENSVLIAMYGATVGQFAIIGQEATCNQAICACIPNNDYPYTFVYYTIKSNVEELKSRAVGSAQQNISQVLIKNLNIAVNDNISKFHLEVNPMMKKIKSNTIQIRTLERLRDALLPKLMSGEVRVKK